MIAKCKNIWCSPRKVGVVAKNIRNMEVDKARRQLDFGKNCDILRKLINSAVANSKKDSSLLIVSEVLIGRGQKFRRFRPRAKGRADSANKNTANITIKLKDKE